MIIKRFNAVLSLITILLLLTHIGYTSFAYLTMYYNPLMTKVFSIPFMVSVCIHGVLGMSQVFMNSDGTALGSYPKLNRATLMQRLSAALIFPLVFVHVNTFGYMQANAESGTIGVIILLMATEILLFAAALCHASISFSRALITLGLLTSRDTQKKIDRIFLIAAMVILAIASFAVVRGQAIMFIH